MALPNLIIKNNSLRSRGLTLCAGVAILSLSACAVGPDFKQPEAPKTQTGAQYTETPLAKQTLATAGLGGQSQQLIEGQDIPAEWWTLFHSESLDQLVRQALANNPNLASAQFSLRQAQEGFNAVSGSLAYPNINGGLSTGRERVSAVSTGIPNGYLFNLYNAQVNVSYTVDVFGANSRTLEGQQAAVEVQKFQLEATYLALTSNVVTAAIREASLRAQLQSSQDLLSAQEKQLVAVEQQYTLGAVSRQPALAQRTVVAQTKASIPALEKALAQTRHQLSVYVGKLPSEGGIAEFQLDALQLPEQLPVSLPSELVRQRPDIRASEALLHEAAAQLGVATANLYPQFNLTGSYGSSAFQSNQLFGSGWTFWSLIAGMTAPIYDGGALRAKRRGAEAGFEAAANQYRGTVLVAFQNVADSLRAVQDDANALNAQAQAEGLAKESLALSTQQYQLGGISYVALLDAQRSYQQARINLVAARAARYADTAALFQALGGGWWNRKNEEGK
jgi:NodT family efflux transporter outer membrane factor (OMF) lipoprotein